MTEHLLTIDLPFDPRRIVDAQSEALARGGRVLRLETSLRCQDDLSEESRAYRESMCGTPFQKSRMVPKPVWYDLLSLRGPTHRSCAAHWADFLGVEIHSVSTGPSLALRYEITSGTA